MLRLIAVDSVDFIYSFGALLVAFILLLATFALLLATFTRLLATPTLLLATLTIFTCDSLHLQLSFSLTRHPNLLSYFL